ncbi:hypothetical protein FJZ18_00120 [Candidatus Pacearchaeota archaeon]|nr:hypothetical protein [Candidatus Pacearchaeota archaeon]
MKNGHKILLGIAAVGAIGTLTGMIYRIDRKEIDGWYSLTNTIPEMIARGETSEAREIYVDTWRDINQRIRDSGRDPISLISPSVIKRLEKDFTWDVLMNRAREYRQNGLTNAH